MRHLGTIDCEGRDRLITLILTPAARGSQYTTAQCNPTSTLSRTGVGNRDALVIQPPSVLTCAVPSDTSGGLA
jgi:hypothetical protein